MHPALRLAIPILLGGAAAGINWSVESSKLQPGFRGIRFKQAVESGQPIVKDALEEFSLAGDPERWRKTAVPYDNRAAIYGMAAPRAFAEGDILLVRDTFPAPAELVAAPGEKILPISLGGLTVEPSLLKVGDKVGFLIAGPDDAAGGESGEDPGSGLLNPRYIGPFTLLSVGGELERSPRGAPGPRGNGTVITVAIRFAGDGEHLDPRSRALVDAIAPGRDRDGGGKIVSIVLEPGRVAPGPGPARP